MAFARNPTRPHALLTLAALLACATAACDRDPNTAPASDVTLLSPVDASKAPSNPTATWSIPLDTTGLALRSDGLFGSGGNSVYANAVCTVSATIFYYGPTGDATLQMSAPKGGKCGRTITLAYPDGFRETLASFSNLNILESGSFSIPVGTTARRRLIVAPGALANNPSRCGRLLFGPNGSVSPGTDSVLVTRVDASTWQVQSQAAPDDRALCEDTGVIYEMPVRFVIRSSVPLP